MAAKKKKSARKSTSGKGARTGGRKKKARKKAGKAAPKTAKKKKKKKRARKKAGKAAPKTAKKKKARKKAGKGAPKTAKKKKKKKTARKKTGKAAPKKVKKKAAAKKRPTALSVKKAVVKRRKKKKTPRIDTSQMYALYEEGLGLLHRNQYSRARAKFAQLIQKFAFDTEVTARAQAFVKVCDKHLKKKKKKKKKSSRTPEAIFNEGVFHHNAGRYQEALDSLSHALRLAKRHKDHIYYAMAAAEVSLGNTDQGLKLLRKALDLNEENRFFASNDPDFEALAENQAFLELINPEE